MLHHWTTTPCPLTTTFWSSSNIANNVVPSETDKCPFCVTIKTSLVLGFHETIWLKQQWKGSEKQLRKGSHCRMLCRILIYRRHISPWFYFLIIALDSSTEYRVGACIVCSQDIFSIACLSQAIICSLCTRSSTAQPSSLDTHPPLKKKQKIKHLHCLTIPWYFAKNICSI